MGGIWRLYKDDWRLSIEDGGYSKDLEVIYVRSVMVICIIWRLSETRVGIELLGQLKTQ